jgi:NifU-like protein involved in Fe-S cluster formation
MSPSIYTLDILRLAADIPHCGQLSDPDGFAERRSATCGSRIRVEVNLDSHGRVSELGQEVHACAFGQAAASLMAAGAIGRSLAEATATKRELADWLAGRREDPGWNPLEVLDPARSKTGRHEAMLLPFDALEAAIRAAHQPCSGSGATATIE